MAQLPPDCHVCSCVLEGGGWPVADTSLVFLHLFLGVCLVCNAGLAFGACGDLEPLLVPMLMLLIFLLLILYLPPQLILSNGLLSKTKVWSLSWKKNSWEKIDVKGCTR